MEKKGVVMTYEQEIVTDVYNSLKNKPCKIGYDKILNKYQFPISEDDAKKCFIECRALQQKHYKDNQIWGF